MTRLRAMRRLTVGYFIAYAIFTTFPGVVPFRGPGPFILGLPLPLVWVALWVIGGFFVLLALDRAYRADDEGE